jgi:phthiocerol/phenolphthiocerol synthesis type-I polyketide synthase E
MEKSAMEIAKNTKSDNADNATPLSSEQTHPSDRRQSSSEEKYAVQHASLFAESFHDEVAGDPAAIKESTRNFYNQVSTQLNHTIFGEYAYFLNYGYVSTGSTDYSRIQLPKRSLNRNCVKLVLELVADCSLDGKQVLDIGCGRGGTVRTLKDFFYPSKLVGLDLCPEAIDFCRRTHQFKSISFFEGDAEALPFQDHAFDVVTNVESSHSYPNRQAFYAEVYRVLSPGGYFLYTDVFSQEQILADNKYLELLGFDLEIERDITGNVLLSCDEIASFRAEAYDSKLEPSIRDIFLGVPGSTIYEDMRCRKAHYGMWRFRKSR